MTNTAEPAAEVVKRYKSLADIERGFRVLKSDIEIVPVYHRLPQRIRRHPFVQPHGAGFRHLQPQATAATLADAHRAVRIVGAGAWQRCLDLVRACRHGMARPPEFDTKVT